MLPFNSTGLPFNTYCPTFHRVFPDKDKHKCDQWYENIDEDAIERIKEQIELGIANVIL